MDNQLFFTHENQFEEHPICCNFERLTSNGNTLEHRYSEFIISPYLGPFDGKINIMQSLEINHKENFLLTDDLNLYGNFNEQDEKSWDDQSEISQIPSAKNSPLSTSTSIDSPLAGRSMEYRHQTSRSANGLRVLSQNVFEIVLEQKYTTYKEVAEKLVVDFKFRSKKTKCEEKEQKNIKRRVYDALNVLVAAEIIQKEGKQVASWTKASVEKKHRQQNSESYQTLVKINNQIQEKQKILQEKRQQLEELKRRQEVLEAILKRNAKKKYKNKPKINFPIVGFLHDKVQDDAISLTNDNQKFQMTSTPIDYVFGDMDMVMRIDMASQTIEEMIQTQDFEEEMQH